MTSLGVKHTEEWKAAARRRMDWAPADLAILREGYERARIDRRFDLGALATKLNRPKQSVSRKARKLGLTDRRRRRVAEYKQRPRRGTLRKYATDQERAVAQSVRVKAMWASRPHPRGMLGKTHTPEICARISDANRTLVVAGKHPWQQPRSEAQREAQSQSMTRRLKSMTSVYSSSKYGRREDLGNQFFRSRWEANYARFLDLLKSQGQLAQWEYEAETFWFEAIRRGVRSYTPDFKITEASGGVYFVEVKGWMDPKSQTKIKRMAKYHPAVDLRVVGERAYSEIARKLAGAIPGWEYDERGRR